MMFRDATEATKRKATRSTKTNPERPQSKSQLVNESSQRSSLPKERVYGNQRLEPISRQLSPSLEQQSLCFFLSNYVLVPRQPYCSRGYLEYLLPLYQSNDSGNHLSLAVSAVAMAAFGSRPAIKSFSQHARQTYGKALYLTNEALRDPVEVKEDRTLMAVLLLGLYEVVKV
jgi:hypothetical protein